MLRNQLIKQTIQWLSYAVLLTALVCLFSSKGSAQYSIIYNDASGVNLANNDVHACQEVADSVHVVRILIEDDAADNALVLIEFPTGMDWLPGSLNLVSQVGGLSITETNISAPNTRGFIINPTNLNDGDEITFSYSRVATCAAINHQSNGGTFKDDIIVSGGAGTVSEDNPNLANYDLLVPAISVFNEGPITTNVGSTVTREIRIVNGGLGFLQDISLEIDDKIGTSTTSLVTPNGTTVNPNTSGSIHS